MQVIRRLIALVAFVVTMIACAAAMPRPTPVSGAGCPLADKALNDAYNQETGQHGCKEAFNSKGQPFIEACINSHYQGHPMNTECLAGVTDCAQVPLCR